MARFAKEKKGFDLLPSIAKLLDERKIDQWTIVGHNSKIYRRLKIEKFRKYFKYLDNIENLDEKFFHTTT